MFPQTVQVGRKFVEVPALEKSGENWTTYCEKLTEAACILGVTSYLSGTQPEPFDLLRDVKILRIIHSTVPARVHHQLTKLNSASECFKTLKILFGGSITTATTTVPHERCDAEPQVAARTPKPFVGITYEDNRERVDYISTHHFRARS